jgi:hypothetical protein
VGVGKNETRGAAEVTATSIAEGAGDMSAWGKKGVEFKGTISLAHGMLEFHRDASCNLSE